jgi:ribosome maturation factor RimP
MRKAPEKLNTLIHNSVQAMGYEMVGVEMLGQGSSSVLLRVYIDNERGINLNDCSKVSHQLSGILDVADLISDKYELEVSSPGLDRPLFTLDHFKRFMGHRLNVSLIKPLRIQERYKFNGILIGINDNQVLIKDNEVVYFIPLEQIETARLVPKF